MNLAPCQHLTESQQAEVDKAAERERRKLQPVSKAVALASYAVLVANHQVLPVSEHWVNVERRLRGE